MASSTTTLTYQQPGAGGHKHIAPLASLDCSITDCQASNGPANAVTTTSTPETPTLSGYFDCDELSDMVDDSLFEITNAGCLSRSVFGPTNRNCGVESDDRKALDLRVNGESNDSFKIAAKNSHQDDENDVNTLQRCQQHNESWTEVSQFNNKESDEKLQGQVQVPAGNGKFCTSNDQKSQLAALASYKPYDYSSTSTIPAQVRQSSSNNAAFNSIGNRQRSKSARFVSTSSSSAKNDSLLTTTTAQNTSNDNNNRLQPQQRSSQRRKARSNPDVRNETGEDSCSICRNEREEQAITTTSSSSDRSNKRKEKKRFTFSLFNLFNSNSSSSSGATAEHHSTCIHHKQAGNKPIRPLSAKRPIKIESHISAIKSRDSIKLTNQRKQRNQSTAVRPSNSFTDFQKRPTVASELLLDFSRGNRAQPAALRSSQSSYSIHQQQQSHLYRRADKDHAANEKQLSANNNKSQRQTKSVKFNTPDLVMILPASSSSLSSSNLYTSKSALIGAGGATFSLPPADLQPMAPIIKRPVSKSSSYSQTESNKNLEEMLASYERNSELIAAINEKLNLTEAITSPRSVLNGDCSGDGDEADEGDDGDGEGERNEEEEENSVVEVVSKTITISTTEICRPSDDFNACDDEQRVSQPLTGRAYDSVLMDSTPFCDPDNGDTVQNSSAEGATSIEAEEAGFSKDWLNKQRALV